MKKKYLLIILLFLVGITVSHAQYTSIPDANFEAALVALGHDSVSGDGQVLTADIATITELDIRNDQITDLTGIEDFSSLQELRANFNSISSVDLSQNTALETLFIGDNNLTALDVSANVNLDYLSINDLNLTSGIDISQNTKLTNFVAENTNLSTIDVSNNVLLQQLNLEGNNLTTLDVTNLTALEQLYIHDNQLSTLDLSNNTQLQSFGFDSNNFVSLDFSGLSNLVTIDGSANSNLTTVNLEGVTALENFQVNTASLTSLDLSDATNLNFLSAIGSQLETLDLSNNTVVNIIQIPNNNLTSLDLRNIDLTQASLNASGNNNLECISVSDVAAAEQYLGEDFRYSIDCGTYTYVPDDNFEAALAAYDDIPGDDNVPTANIETLTTLDVSSQNIADLRGIEDFAALVTLNASNNNLEQVDFSNNVGLQEINIAGNALKILDVSALINLTSLQVNNNELFQLNIQNGANTNLISFDATGNADLTCILVDNETYADTNLTNIDNQTSFSETDCTIYVAIPDTNFETALAAYDDISNDGQVPLANIYFVTTLDVSGATISDLTGIESFISLKELNCNNNSLTSIDVSAIKNLEVLYIENNQLTTLDLSQNLLLNEIDCDINSFTTLDFSNNVNLVNLYADDNPLLTTINTTGCILLEEMIADDNNINILDLTTNVNLKILDLDNNNLTTLDLSQNILLEDIDLDTNQLTNIDLTSLVNLIEADLENNLFTSVDFSQNVLLENVDVDINQVASLDFSNNVALTRVDIDENPLLTNVTFGNSPNLTQVYADQTAIETIDVSSLTGLRTLDLGESNLKTLDVSSNSSLTDLRVDNAALVSLDLRNGNNSNFTRMNATVNAGLGCIMVDDATAAVTDFTDVDAGVTFRETTCGYTLIPDANFEQALEDLGYDDISQDGKVPTVTIEVVTSLDLSSKSIADLTGIEDFAALVDLNCEVNDLAILDLSSNTSLETLDCDSNSLTSLTLPVNGNMQTLICNNNANLASVNLNNNINLELIQLASNNLTSIDLSNLTALTQLYLNNNSLTTVDLSNNTALEAFSGSNNQLSAIDLSLNSNLVSLSIDDNSITSLDLQNNITLQYVTLSNNSIGSIDVSNNINLLWLYAQNCGLSSIDVSKNTLLEKLWVNDNNLISLSVEENTALTEIAFYNNVITTLDVSKNSTLQWLIGNNNRLTNLDLSANSLLSNVNLDSNILSSLNLQNGNNTNLFSVILTNNDNLNCVLVDDEDYSNNNWLFIDSQTTFNEVSCDTTAPVITLNGANPQTIELGAGYTELGATTDDGSAVSIDASEFMDAVGSYTIYYDATDAAGNTAIQVIRTVDVVDTTAPVITLNGANPQTIELGAGYTELGATIDDGSAVSIDTSEFMDAVGSYTIYYDATDAAGNVAIQVTRTVDVVDTTAPVITLNGANPQTIELGAGYSELGATTDDGTAVSIDTSEFMDAVGSYTIYYDATDAAGNAAIQVTRTVDVVDTTAPIITLNGANPQTIELGAGYTELGATTDDGSVVSIDTLEFMDAVGSYTIYYDATDAAGNAAIQVTRTVNVVDTTNPTVVCQNITVQLDDTGNASITAAMIDNGSTDLSGIASIVIDVTDFDCTNIGDNMVTLTVTDANGNTDMCMATVTVEDEVAPEFDMTTVPTDMEVPFDTGNMYMLADFTVGVVVTDNCDANKSALANTITQSPVAGTLLAEGDHVITLTATDDNLNIETVSFTITVSGVLSVEENTEDIFSLYPNPATDQFWITGVSGEAEVTFYDINGRMLQTIKVMNEQAVSTTDLSAGVYLITIEQNDIKQTIRLIKK